MWQVTEMALFGSVLRDDFGPDSDIDVPSAVVSRKVALATSLDMNRMARAAHVTGRVFGSSDAR